MRFTGQQERLRVYCTRHKESRSCDNNRSIYLDVIERKVFGGLREHLLNPQAVEIFLRRYDQRRKQLAREAQATQRDTERQIREITAKINRTLDVYVEGDDSHSADEVRRKLEQMEQVRAGLRKQLEVARQPVQTFALHPAAQARYLALIARRAMGQDGHAGQQACQRRTGVD